MKPNVSWESVVAAEKYLDMMCMAFEIEKLPFILGKIVQDRALSTVSRMYVTNALYAKRNTFDNPEREEIYIDDLWDSASRNDNESWCMLMDQASNDPLLPEQNFKHIKDTIRDRASAMNQAFEEECSDGTEEL